MERLFYSPLCSMNELLLEISEEKNPDGVYISVDALYLPEENYWASPFYEKLGFISIDPPKFDTIRMYRKVHDIM